MIVFLLRLQTLADRRLASLQSMSQIALLEDIFSVGGLTHFPTDRTNLSKAYVVLFRRRLMPLVSTAK